jgi:hypothetical protein
MPKNKLLRQVELFAHENDLDDILPYLQKGALLAQHPKEFETIPELDEADRVIIRRETTRQSALLSADSLTEISIRPMASASGSLYDRYYLQSRCRRPVSYLFFSASLYYSPIIRGWDQTGSNGANLSFPQAFGISTDPTQSPEASRNQWIVGLINSGYAKFYSITEHAYDIYLILGHTSRLVSLVAGYLIL